MERAQALLNLWRSVRIVVSVVVVGCVLEFVSDRHFTEALRALIAVGFGRDPATPKIPESWDEWVEWYTK